MTTPSFFAGHPESCSIWLETTTLPGGLSHHGNWRDMRQPYPFAGLCQGFVQGHARCLSSSAPTGFLLAGCDADDPLWAENAQGAFPGSPIAYS